MHSLILGGLLLIIGYQMLLAGMHFRAFGAAWGLSRVERNEKADQLPFPGKGAA